MTDKKYSTFVLRWVGWGHETSVMVGELEEFGGEAGDVFTRAVFTMHLA